MRRQSAILIGLVLAMTTVGGCIIVDDDSPDSSLTIANRSTYVITEVNVTEVSSSTWGPDLVPQDLFPNEDLVVALDCGTYDVRILDDGVPAAECILSNFDTCFDDSTWVITDSLLNSCF